MGSIGADAGRNETVFCFLCRQRLIVELSEPTARLLSAGAAELETHNRIPSCTRKPRACGASCDEVVADKSAQTR